MAIIEEVTLTEADKMNEIRKLSSAIISRPPSSQNDLSSKLNSKVPPRPMAPSQFPPKRIFKLNDEMVVLKKEIQFYLNRLTPITFDKIVAKLSAVNITSLEALLLMIDLIFEKYFSEPNYSKMYADLCAKLIESIKVEFPEPGKSGLFNFRRCLVGRCQDSFEKRHSPPTGYTDPEMKDLTKREKEELQVKIRKQNNSNIKFIGELYKSKVLSEKLMHFCLRALLPSKNDEKVVPDDIHNFYQLMSVIGKNLEVKSSKIIDEYFGIIERIAQRCDTPSQLRFALQDVIDLRRNKWQPRRGRREDDTDPRHDEEETFTEDEDEEEEAQPTPVTKKKLPQDDVGACVNFMFDILATGDVHAAVACFRGWNAPHLHKEIFEMTLGLVIERDERMCAFLSKFFSEIKDPEVSKEIESAFTFFMEIIDELLLDIPHAGVQLGMCLGYCCTYSVLPKNFLQQITTVQLCFTRAAAEKILKSAFRAAIKAKDFANCQSLWDSNPVIHSLFDKEKLLGLI